MDGKSNDQWRCTVSSLFECSSLFKGDLIVVWITSFFEDLQPSSNPRPLWTLTHRPRSSWNHTHTLRSSLPRNSSLALVPMFLPRGLLRHLRSEFVACFKWKQRSFQLCAQFDILLTAWWAYPKVSLTVLTFIHDATQSSDHAQKKIDWFFGGVLRFTGHVWAWWTWPINPLKGPKGRSNGTNRTLVMFLRVLRLVSGQDLKIKTMKLT